MRVVVTGANRGIGLELCRQLLDRGDTVEAGVRRPAEKSGLTDLGQPALHVHALDVSSDASVSAFEVLAREDPRPVEVLINNAGVFGPLATLEAVDLDEIRAVFEVNALGPIRVTRALLPLLRRGTAGVGRGPRPSRKVVNITSRMGSVAENTSGGVYPYRMSKAAMNMATRCMAIDLAKEGILAAVMNPGWVKTDMGGHNAPTRVEDCARGILSVIDAMGPAQSGAFLDYRGGGDVPW